MLKSRIIPTLLWDGVQCVKPVAFERPYRKLGPIEQYIQVIERRNVDELILIDIEATNEGRKPKFEAINRFASNLYCPLTVGGGVSSLDDIKELLANGADKVAIRSIPGLIPGAVKKFGAQAIVSVIDYQEGDNPWVTAVYNQNLGAGEILLTSMFRDGGFLGYDLDTIRLVSNAVRIPVIASGGCRYSSDMLAAIRAGASAVAAGSMYLYTDITPRDSAKLLKEKGVNVRYE